MGSKDTRYFKRESRRSAVAFGVPLRNWARIVASAPSGGRMQRAALAWLKRKCPTCARAAEDDSRERDASLARKAAAKAPYQASPACPREKCGGLLVTYEHDQESTVPEGLLRCAGCGRYSESTPEMNAQAAAADAAWRAELAKTDGAA